MVGEHRLVGALAGAVAAALVLAGCTGYTGYAPPSPDPNADSIVSVTTENLERALADLPDAVEAALAATGTPGVAVAVVHGGETVFAEGYGVRRLDRGTPVDADTVFPLASMSKSLGATVVARAVDAGIVSWDTPVVANLPDFALQDPWVSAHVTIADMYAHRSGLYEHAGDELEDLGYDRATILERLREVPLASFRDDYAYGNFDITAAAESVARAAGTTWEELSDRLLYEPLGMLSTSSRHDDLIARQNRALGHVPEGDGWVVSPSQRQPDAQSAAGGVSSSATDIATWMTMVLESDGFISADALLPAISAQIPTAPPGSAADRGGFYGYGFNVSTTAAGLNSVSHSGAFLLGAGTTFTLLPAADLGIVVLSNAQANGVAEAVAHRFTDIAQFGEERADWLQLYSDAMSGLLAPSGDLAGQTRPADPLPSAPLESYVGDYANDYYGAARVSLANEALVLELGPQGRWMLQHWDDDVFAFAPAGENGSPGSLSSATFDGDELVLGMYDEHGLGTFVR